MLASAARFINFRDKYSQIADRMRKKKQQAGIDGAVASSAVSDSVWRSALQIGLYLYKLGDSDGRGLPIGRHFSEFG